ncbi:hypothetical protein AVEN_91851-1 [Araneus ventricosus]|uniref:ENTH domain-containing protein n=1 Tax=Araneus ventricosus TaxID=182803 RepID=A0A4Y2G5H3_ARAVE|nr:hypothetical protein AVEN_91851-1 [Araneus ventricosus]
MEASQDDKTNEESKEKAKVRRWILKAVEDVERNIGATAHHIQKFLDSKEDGSSNKPEWKLILKKLLDSGHLMKNGGRYVIHKSKKTSLKGTKNSAASKANKSYQEAEDFRKKVRRISARRRFKNFN